MALSDNLVAYWPLDEASGDAIDAHGSNDLTETGGTIGATTGKVSGCRDFEAGDTEYFEHADNADLSTGDIDWTIACWVNAESLSANNRIVSKLTGGPWEYQLFYRSSKLFALQVFTAAGSLIGTTEASTFGTPSTGTWYFLVAWHDSVANEVGIAVNAGTADTASTTGTMSDTAATFQIGSGLGGGYWDGLIDEVGFWKRVLTSAERTELYNSGAGRDYAYITGGGGGGATVPALDEGMLVGGLCEMTGGF